MNSATPRDVAAWMLSEVERSQCLPQLEAVAGIAEKFGTGFLYMNKNGRPAISKDVLREFRSLAEYAVVWDRTAFCWQMRAR
jgi:hypothetical protein